MSIEAECVACKHKFIRPDGMAGKLEKCPACRHVFPLPDFPTKKPGPEPIATLPKVLSAPDVESATIVVPDAGPLDPSEEIPDLLDVPPPVVGRAATGQTRESVATAASMQSGKPKHSGGRNWPYLLLLAALALPPLVALENEELGSRGPAPEDIKTLRSRYPNVIDGIVGDIKSATGIDMTASDSEMALANVYMHNDSARQLVDSLYVRLNTLLHDHPDPVTGKIVRGEALYWWDRNWTRPILYTVAVLVTAVSACLIAAGVLSWAGVGGILGRDAMLTAAAVTGLVLGALNAGYTVWSKIDENICRGRDTYSHLFTNRDNTFDTRLILPTADGLAVGATIVAGWAVIAAIEQKRKVGIGHISKSDAVNQ